MKLNNKGFAISSVMYALLILAVSLMFAIIAILVSRKMTLDKIKDDVKRDVNGEIMNTPAEYKGIEDKMYQQGDEVEYAGLSWQVISDNVSDVTVVLKGTVALNATGVSFANYKNELNTWLKSNAILSFALKENYLVSMDFNDGYLTSKGYVRILSASDIYGNDSLPSEYSLESSVINDCVICNMEKNYMLLTRATSSEALIVIYDDVNFLNYMMKTTVIDEVRPVITIKKYDE